MPLFLTLCLALLACGAPSTSPFSGGVSAPPALPAPAHPFVAKGTCPGGCCQFGLWDVVAPVDLVDTIGGSTVVAHVDAGGKVMADTGEIRVEPVEATVSREKVLRRPSSLDSRAPQHTLRPGDKVTVLNAQGGGYRVLWVDGHYYSDKAAFVDPGGCPAAGDNGCWAESAAPAETWWVQVRTLDGTPGYAPGEAFSGWNRCG